MLRFAAVDAGLRFYFGGSNKSLMRRHREDDPPNRIFDVFNGAGNAFVPPKSGGPAVDSFGCIIGVETWNSETGVCEED